jgi:ubiquinone biosynthesis protein
VVKVRKPEVAELVEVDLKILADLVERCSERFAILEQFDARGLLQEFGDGLRTELDFRRDAANESFFRDTFSKERGYDIPEVIAKFSKERVITHERVDGKKVTDLGDMPKRRRTVVSQRVAHFVLEPAFERGVFYADLHAGNLFVQESGTLAVIDFGMVGHLTPEARRKVADVFMAIGRSDAQRLTDRFIEITAPTHPVNRAVIASEVNRLVERYVGSSFEDVSLGKALGELLELLRRQALRLPSNLAQFFKALVMVEGILQTVDPDLSLQNYLKPLAGKLLYQSVVGDHFGDRLRGSAIDAAELAIDLPKRIDRVLGEIERGNLRIWTRLEDAEPLVGRFERMVERSNSAVLAAACIIGVAVSLQFYHPQGWQQWIVIAFWVAATAAVTVVARTLLGLRAAKTHRKGQDRE